MPSAYLDYMRNAFGGANWVLATRRTDRIERQYGSDVVVVTPKRYKAAELAYRAEFGDPYDVPRAKMYLALKGLLEKHWHYSQEPEWTAALEALKAEQKRP